MIDKEAKEYLDWFEGVDDGLYIPLPIQVVDKKTGQVHQVYCYMVNNFNPDLLNENTILFENYSSKNEFYSEYKKSDDTPENLAIVYNTIKKKIV